MKFIKSIIATAIVVTAMTIATNQNTNAESESEPPSIKNEITINKQKLSDIIIGNFVRPSANRIVVVDNVVQERPLQSENNSGATRADPIARSASPAKRYDSSVEVIGDDTEYRSYNKKTGKWESNCATFATKSTGIDKRLGYGITVQPEGTEPKIGAIVLFKNWHHAGALIAITPDHKFIVRDTNWIVGKITQHILTSDQIKGYIY